MIRPLRNLFLRNGALKLLSIVLAFFLWITLVPEEKIFSEKTFVVPLELRGLAAAFEIAERPTATVDVTIQAPNRLLGQMTSADVQTVLNLSRASLNQEDYPLNPDIVSVPPGAKAVRIFPNKAHLKLERSAEVLMEIQAVTVGKPREGWKVDQIELLPSKVFVRGPESKIKPKEKIRTSPIDITGLDSAQSFEVDLILPRPELRFTTAQTRTTVKISPVKISLISK
jgi:YbbR domain-containing protein